MIIITLQYMKLCFKTFQPLSTDDGNVFIADRIYILKLVFLNQVVLR